jgi:hypothetical protein
VVALFGEVVVVPVVPVEGVVVVVDEPEFVVVLPASGVMLGVPGVVPVVLVVPDVLELGLVVVVPVVPVVPVVELWSGVVPVTEPVVPDGVCVVLLEPVFMSGDVVEVPL